jgi:hypothetical protein
MRKTTNMIITVRNIVKIKNQELKINTTIVCKATFYLVFNGGVGNMDAEAKNT